MQGCAFFGLDCQVQIFFGTLMNLKRDKQSDDYLKAYRERQIPSLFLLTLKLTRMDKPVFALKINFVAIQNKQNVKLLSDSKFVGSQCLFYMRRLVNMRGKNSI